MSVGSGIEHAEGGATPVGMTRQGFQIWLNVPSQHKMDDPSYGTESPEAIPQELVATGVQARLLAGPMGDRVGAFQTKAFVQIVDFDLEANAQVTHQIPASMDCCLLYVYQGQLIINGQPVAHSVAVFDASSDLERDLQFAATAEGPAAAMLFAGKQLNEPIAWRGPIVMNTQEEIAQTFQELRNGQLCSHLT